jgi:pimeloyl-ACP methyl ester carboxylesterase
VGQAAQAQFIQGYTAIPQESISQTTLNRQGSAENAFLKYPDVWNALGTIHTPVLLTNGQLDRGNPAQNAKNLHRKIPGSRLTI